MKNRFIKTLVLLFVLLVLLTTPAITGVNIKQVFYRENNNIEKLLKGGWLEERDGIKILHISGSYYEMGYQYGYYLKEDHMALRRCWLNFIKKEGISIDELKAVWNITEKYIPEVYKEEIKGRADALGIDFIDEAILSVLLMRHNFHRGCFGFAAWGNATVDGKLYHAHSNDWSLIRRSLFDPVTHTYAYQHQVLIVRKPANGYASVSIGTNGGIEAEAGMNEKGICITFNTGFHPTNDTTIKGIPVGIRNVMVLDSAKNSQEAIDILTSNRTTGWNFILSDGNERAGYILEQTANYSYVGRWNDTIEDNYPSWMIKDVVRRGNIFLNYEAPGINRSVYENSSFIRLILSILHLTKEKSFYLPILHYKVVSEEIEKQYGTLDLNNSIKLLRKVYSGRTNFVFFLFQRIIHCFYAETWDQKVFCPETGDIAISFAKKGITAYRTPVHYFNLYELLNSKPSS